MYPLNVYYTFVLKEKYGFNKTTPITFVTDILKDCLVAFAFTVPFIAAFVNIIKWTGEHFVLWLAAFLYVCLVSFSCY
jgi:STE24 endopeptidase